MRVSAYMVPETNRIKEIAPGVYWVLLWCPESHMLLDLLDPQVPFVLCWHHEVGNYTWREFALPIVDPQKPMDVLARIVSVDFVLPTQSFFEILPLLGRAIKVVQLAKSPPDYLDMRSIQGKPLYRILGACGWHVLLDTTANDYGQLISPRREVLERAVEIMQAARR